MFTTWCCGTCRLSTYFQFYMDPRLELFGQMLQGRQQHGDPNCNVTYNNHGCGSQLNLHFEGELQQSQHSACVHLEPERDQEHRQNQIQKRECRNVTRKWGDRQIQESGIPSPFHHMNEARKKYNKRIKKID